jgi:hypothetical protein
MHRAGMKFGLSATRVDSWEGEAPAEPRKSLDINRNSGLAGASPSQPIELLNRNSGEPKFGKAWRWVLDFVDEIPAEHFRQ